MLTNNQKQTPIYFDAEIVDESIQPVEAEQYDSEQVQQAISETDSSITIIQGIAQGAFLAGLQITSTQYLYLAGSIGLFPAVIAGLPVGASLAATLCYLRFHNSIIPQISDRQKFGIGVIRSATLAASSWKLTGDAQDMDKIARNSFSTVTEQVKTYEGIEKPKETNYGLFLGLAAVVSVVLYFYWRKK
jgi:Flp pilus assembly protein TadB